MVDPPVLPSSPPHNSDDVPTPRHGPISEVAVVVPAHNERRRLPACLKALEAAARSIPQRVRLVVVLDACDDGSADVVCAPTSAIRIDAGNVGAARRAGFASINAASLTTTWFATTDADSTVPTDWLRTQVAAADSAADVYVGTVTPMSFDNWPPGTEERYLKQYDARPDHRHVHGANLGFRASAYAAVGGFSSIPADEDVDLVTRLRMAGSPVCWSAAAPVATSTRATGRLAGASAGFAGYLRDLAGRTS